MNLYMREEEINQRRRHISRGDRSMEQIVEGMQKAPQS